MDSKKIVYAILERSMKSIYLCFLTYPQASSGSPCSVHFLCSKGDDMADIIRGTTPTIKFKFDTIKVSDITAAYLTIKAGDTIEKDLAAAEIGSDYIAWKLTQAETLNFGDTIYAMINWKLSDGTRGASSKKAFKVIGNLKEVEI